MYALHGSSLPPTHISYPSHVAVYEEDGHERLGHFFEDRFTRLPLPETARNEQEIAHQGASAIA